ncbi:hypothetical protein DSO57_1001263 [Entomophthora muscae]|uniref:Uncharacterized protein n=1 Tax=Entomophthora muscae TaxID=34485 RepID=A0ACC2T8T9_9FUNG|nr:hypothetical protein DSO57_1001263 [Entomophthora muscae]
MFGWICVAVASVVMALKSITAWLRKDQKSPVTQSSLKAVINLTRPVRESRMIRATESHIYSAGFYGLDLPQELGEQLHWTGKGDFSKAHRIQDTANPRHPYTCTPDVLAQNSFGACFVKNVEGYRIHSYIHRSPPFTCKIRMCTITAIFNLSNIIPFNNLSPENVLEIIQPINVLELAYPANKTTLTISQPFIGPGTRNILLKPIFWSVTGMYLPTFPLGHSERNQTYVTAEFLMLDNGQIDAIYMLNEPKQPTTTPLQ